MTIHAANTEVLQEDASTAEIYPPATAEDVALIRPEIFDRVLVTFAQSKVLGYDTTAGAVELKTKDAYVMPPTGEIVKSW